MSLGERRKTRKRNEALRSQAAPLVALRVRLPKVGGSPMASRSLQVMLRCISISCDGESRNEQADSLDLPMASPAYPADG